MESYNAENEVAEVNPESTHSFYHDNDRLLGHLIIDSSINGISAGGVRLVSEISEFELSHLARAMTLKYSFLNLPLGGAKAAIVTHGQMLSKDQQNEYIRLFSKNLISLKGKYLPGKDIGIDDNDHGLILRTGGFKQYGPRPDSAFYTAVTVLICAEELAKAHHIDLKVARVTIEGFGKVGSWVARQLSGTRCKIIAVSTIIGAIYDPTGLDVNELLDLKEKWGDDCIKKYRNAVRMSKEELLILPTDFLIPCASSWSINLSNVDEIKARVIVCGSNNAVTDKAKQVLRNNNILYFPDFVSNSGGVFGSIMETLFSKRQIATRFVAEAFRPKVQDLLVTSRMKNRSLEEMAKDIAMANFRQMKQKEARPENKLFALALRLFRQGLVPAFLIRIFGPVYFKIVLRL